MDSNDRDSDAVDELDSVRDYLDTIEDYVLQKARYVAASRKKLGLPGCLTENEEGDLGGARGGTSDNLMLPPCHANVVLYSQISHGSP